MTQEIVKGLEVQEISSHLKISESLLLVVTIDMTLRVIAP
jgi:hypothetical protein